MNKSSAFILRFVIMGVMITPLLGNQGCDGQFEAVEEVGEEEVAPDGSGDEAETELQPVPEGAEGDALLESGGPEVNSAPLPEE